jgi:hypothetical protein
MKGNTLLITAILLLLAVLILSRLYPFTEGFQAAKGDLCGVLTKGKADISTQLDQANSLINDANAQLTKIKASLDDVSKMATSFSC